MPLQILPPRSVHADAVEGITLVMIFALFFCMQVTGQCQIVDQSWVGRMQGPLTFSTLIDCQALAIRMSHLEKPDEHGRYVIGLTSNPQWYECRSKHVETWQPATSP